MPHFEPAGALASGPELGQDAPGSLAVLPPDPSGPELRQDAPGPLAVLPPDPGGPELRQDAPGFPRRPATGSGMIVLSSGTTGSPRRRRRLEDLSSVRGHAAPGRRARRPARPRGSPDVRTA